VIGSLQWEWLMDPSNPDDWRKLATAFTSAPLWAVILATGVPVGLAVWWFRGTMFEREITSLKAEMVGKVAGLEGEKSVLEQRLKLADDLKAAFDRVKDELANVQKELQDYKAQVTIEGRNASSAKVDAAIVKANKISVETKKKLVDALMSRNYPVINVDGDLKIR
jgi:hypothetical protein